MKFSPRYGTAITDGLFMSSRDGRVFKRWGEAFIRPGIECKHNWVYGDGYQNWGVIETAAEDPLAPPELSFYATENIWKTATRLRRYTLRLDGFVSLAAPLKGGEVSTKPLIFTGSALTLNFATSAAGAFASRCRTLRASRFPGSRWGSAWRCSATGWTGWPNGKRGAIWASWPASRSGCVS